MQATSRNTEPPIGLGGEIDFLTLPAPIGASVLDRSRTFLFHSSLPEEQLGYRIKVPVVRTFAVTNQPKLSRSHTNSTDLTSRLPDGRSTRDHRKIAAYEQTLKRSAPRAPVLYHRPIGRCFTTGWITSGYYLGESLILITTTVHRAQDSRLDAKISKQGRRPNAAMIFMSQKNHLREAAPNGSMSVTDHSR